MQFIVLSSSNGSVFEATLEAIEAGELTAECIGLVTDKADRGCIQKAEAAGVPVTIVEREAGESRTEYDQRLHEAIASIRGQSTEPLVLAAMGWMFILSPEFVARYPQQILNVHPALLPKYGGEGMYGMHVHEAVLDAGEAETGATIHYLDEGVDTGPIVAQQSCPVEPDDTPESLKEKVLELEKELYPAVLQQLHDNA